MRIYDITLGEYGYEGAMDFPLFHRAIEVYFDEDVTEAYAQTCAEYVSNLPEAVVEKLCAFSIAYCENFREFFEEEKILIPEQVSGREILKHIRPSSLIVDAPQGDTIGFRMELNCDWEEEHGMEWVINDGEVLFVGGFGGENPWSHREYFQRASWNYAVVAAAPLI